MNIEFIEFTLRDLLPSYKGVIAYEDYIYFVKDSRANVSGVSGYYAEVKLTNNKTSKAELFSVGSEISESSK